MRADPHILTPPQISAVITIMHWLVGLLQEMNENLYIVIS
jgi:hypothetical protein